MIRRFSFGLVAIFALAIGLLPGGQGTAPLGVSSLTSPAAAASRVQWPGPFRVEVLAVKDGDTLQVALLDHCPFGCIDLGERSTIAVRLRGVDAPEIHACKTSVTPSCAACPAELSLARKAQARVTALIRDHPARLVQIGADKYRGRVVADLQVFAGGGWQSLSETLLNEHLAVPYEGGIKTKPWCEDQ